MSLNVLMRLRALLSPQNILYLDVILKAITDKDTPVYQILWPYLYKQFNHNQNAVNSAYNGLCKLRQIVLEYQGPEQPKSK